MKKMFALGLLLLGGTAWAEEKTNLPITPGPFKPTMESLLDYKCPEWFRDAKFGMWAHWGPQAVPMDGDWYARGMYEQGSRHYKYHLEHYGHPSVFGYKDIIPLWKAEKWEPERLMALYKRAGAKYFVSMGTHHDNFFLWDSKIHKWNAVNMGPKRDVVATWKKAALKEGLKFGVSEHLGASFTWFQSSHKSDKTGPKAGVPYDGTDPKYQDLYHPPADPDDKSWYSKNPQWQQKWYTQVKELLDNYQPDVVFTDGDVAFHNEVGLSLIADYYNASAARNNGKAEVAYFSRQKSEGRWVQDYERGSKATIDPYPWQTDTSIGDWFYNRDWKFRPVSWVIHMLVDTVSKNGNLLMNIVQRPDGSLDPEVEQMLEQMAGWIAIHGEAIYSTRPWTVPGEGPSRTKGGSFNENTKYSAKDIRFTTKGATLYATALGWPEDGRVVIRSLAKPAGEDVNNIKDIRLLGFDGEVKWQQTPEALIVTLPEKKVSEFTTSLRITATNLKAIPVVVPVEPVRPNEKGTLFLTPEDAEIHGGRIQVEHKGGRSCLGFWDHAADKVTWNVQFPAAGKFQVKASYATTHPASELVVEVAGQQCPGKAIQTGAWDRFQNVDLGQVEIAQAGKQVVTIRPKDAAHWKAINLRSVTLQPAK